MQAFGRGPVRSVSQLCDEKEGEGESPSVISARSAGDIELPCVVAFWSRWCMEF